MPLQSSRLYEDLAKRTNGEIYLGVVGPVRTGKSTFIKRFMEQLVLPGMVDIHNRQRAMDELPQSAQGTTIMTTEPKFVPQEAVKISLEENLTCMIRLVDCVGFMVEGATGHMENGKERMVKTPWYDYDIPFSKAARLGTEKVIRDHATIGILVTTDGTIGDIPRSNYEAAEQETVDQLKIQKKPYIVILNSKVPDTPETVALAGRLQEQYDTQVIPLNVADMTKTDILSILEAILLEFPVTQIRFALPSWIEALPLEHEMKQAMIAVAMEILDGIDVIRDVYTKPDPQSEYIESISVSDVLMEDGSVGITVVVRPEYYYAVLSDILGQNVENEYDFMQVLKDIADKRIQYQEIAAALDQVKTSGYGCVTPEKSEITLDKPEIIRHGNKYGVKITAKAPSLHLIQANVTTEIAPIVGTKEQAEDLISYMEKDIADDPEHIWDVNIFGKSIHQLVDEGMHGKTTKLTQESQLKLQESMEKIINEGNGGLVCIII